MNDIFLYTKEELLSKDIDMVLCVEYVNDFHFPTAIEKMALTSSNYFKEEIYDMHEKYNKENNSSVYPYQWFHGNFYDLCHYYRSTYYGDISEWLNEKSYLMFCSKLLPIKIVQSGDLEDKYNVLLFNDGTLKGFISYEVAKANIDKNVRDLIYGNFLDIKKYGYKIIKEQWKNIINN